MIKKSIQSNLIFTKTDIEHISKIYRIPVSFSEMDYFISQLSATAYLLKIFQKMRIRIKGMKPAYHAAKIKNVLREDETDISLSNEEALLNAAKKYKGFFLVPFILKTNEQSKH